MVADTLHSRLRSTITERRRNHPNTQPWDLADARELTYAADYLSARLTEETTP